MIISGRLLSGERIVESKIAREWGVGQPTVREALKTLESEGLVTYSPNRGCSVTELTMIEIGQLTRIRSVFESLSIELAVEKRSAWDPRILRNAIQEMKDAAVTGDANHYFQTDLAFHQKLWELSDNPFLSKALATVVLPLFSFVLRKHYQEKQIDLVENAREHEQLAEAIISCEPADVQREVEKVLGGFRNLYLSLSKNGNENEGITSPTKS